MTHADRFFLGIDISKRQFDVALLKPDGKWKHKKFQNQANGFEQLADWLTKLKVGRTHACMEATNVYGEALAEFLFDQGYDVSVVNPARIKGFAQGELLRTKTDKQDAALIARFCQAMSPAHWQPDPLPVRELRALVRRLEALNTMKQQEQNRLDVADTVVRPDLESHIADLVERIARLQQDIDDHIDGHPELKEQKDLMSSIPGVGPATIATCLAHFVDVHRFSNAKKLASFCGVAPRQFESGTSLRGRGAMSKIGSSQLRKALYFPAMVALRYNPAMAGLQRRMTEKGKAKKLIIGAAMRKLIHIIYGVLKHKTPFSSEVSYA